MTSERRQELTWLLFEKKKQEMLEMEIEDINKRFENKDMNNAAVICKLKKALIVKEYGIGLDSYDGTTKIIMLLDINNLIHGNPTYIVYDMYTKMCNNFSIDVVSKVHFSRFVVKYFDYVIVDKTIKRKKYRIYLKKESVHKVTEKNTIKMGD